MRARRGGRARWAGVVRGVALIALISVGSVAGLIGWHPTVTVGNDALTVGATVAAAQAKPLAQATPTR